MRSPYWGAFLARHSGEGRNPVLSLPFPLKCKASTRPAGERVTFLCLCKEKSPKETHPGGAVSGHPALRLREPVPGVAERTSVCAQRPRAHPARAPSGFSSTRSPRHRGPVSAASCRRSSRRRFSPLRQIYELDSGFRRNDGRKQRPSERERRAVSGSAS